MTADQIDRVCLWAALLVVASIAVWFAMGAPVPR